MRKQERERAAKRRIARAEAECNATILRAFNKVLRVLEREKVEHLIAMDRAHKKVRR